MNSTRWAWAEIDLGAVRNNVRVIRDVVAPSGVLAVVKADGYGHGAAAIATAALEAGAVALGVALVQEGVELREAGITAPILIMSQQPVEQSHEIVRADLTPTVYDAAAVDALDRAATELERTGRSAIGVHVKVDTGMHRVGCRPDDVVLLAKQIEAAQGLRLAGVFTHLAIADDPADPYTARQLAMFDEALAGIVASATERLRIVTHAANSAGALAHPASRRSFVRLGIAMYGIEPGDGVAGACGDLQPVMSLKARVSYVKRVAADERISYGLRHRFAREAPVATVPVGYADGVPRRLFQTGGEVLIGGRRRPIVGVVTMDQLMVDCGDDSVDVGDVVVLIGRQGDETIRAEEWARRLDTIPYEVTCAISKRIDRRIIDPPAPPAVSDAPGDGLR